MSFRTFLYSCFQIVSSNKHNTRNLLCAANNSRNSNSFVTRPALTLVVNRFSTRDTKRICIRHCFYILITSPLLISKRPLKEQSKSYLNILNIYANTKLKFNELDRFDVNNKNDINLKILLHELSAGSGTRTHESRRTSATTSLDTISRLTPVRVIVTYLAWVPRHLLKTHCILYI